MSPFIERAGGSGGGSQPGSVITRKFPFTHDTPSLDAGAELYTPAIGDILMDAWVEIVTAWDGTTPLGDYGQFNDDDPQGLLHAVMGNVFSQISISQSAACLDMTNADHFTSSSPGLLRGNQIGSLRDAYALYNAFNMFTTGADLSGSWGVNNSPSAAGSLMGNGNRIPYKFRTADPIKVCVSQDGTPSGGSPAATAGSAILYLVTCTPA